MSVGASLLFLFLLAQDPRLPPDRLPRSEPDVRGKILEIHKETLREGHRAARGLLLIQQLPTPQQSAFHKVYVIVGEETRLFEMRGTEFESAEFDDLNVGQEIKAWVRGGMMHPVYPVRLFATAIAIIHPKPESEIFKISGTDRPHRYYYWEHLSVLKLKIGILNQTEQVAVRIGQCGNLHAATDILDRRPDDGTRLYEPFYGFIHILYTPVGDRTPSTRPCDCGVGIQTEFVTPNIETYVERFVEIGCYTESLCVPLLRSREILYMVNDCAQTKNHIHLR